MTNSPSQLRYLLILALLILALLACAAACDPQAPTNRGVVVQPAGVQAHQIVARINGAPILRRDLELQMHGGQGRPAALRALIQQEVLAQEARRRGFDRDPQVLHEQKRAMANLLVRRGFRSHFTKADIPRNLIEAAYKLNRRRYLHGELVEVSHIIALAAKNQDAAHHRKAQKLAQQAHDIAAAAPLTVQAFKQIAVQVNNSDPEVVMRAEGPFMSPRPPARLVPEFLEVAFKLHKPGAISPVFQTQFGYHVIYLQQRLPAINISIDQAEAEIREKIFEQARQQGFERWTKQLEQTLGAKLLESAGAAWTGSGR